MQGLCRGAAPIPKKPEKMTKIDQIPAKTGPNPDEKPGGVEFPDSQIVCNPSRGFRRTMRTRKSRWKTPTRGGFVNEMVKNTVILAFFHSFGVHSVYNLLFLSLNYIPFISSFFSKLFLVLFDLRMLSLNLLLFITSWFNSYLYNLENNICNSPPPRATMSHGARQPRICCGFQCLIHFVLYATDFYPKFPKKWRIWTDLDPCPTPVL